MRLRLWWRHAPCQSQRRHAMISLNQALWRKWCYLANDGRTLSVMEYEDWRTPNEKAWAEWTGRQREEQARQYSMMGNVQGGFHLYAGARHGASPPSHGLWTGLLGGTYWGPR